MRLQFTDLLDCDIIRDGGSYEASLRCDDGRVLALDLEIVGRQGRVPEYGELIESSGGDHAGRASVALGGEREREIVEALEDLLARAPAPDAAEGESRARGRLRELLHYLPGRTGEKRRVARHADSGGTLVVVATLTIVPGRLDAFRVFERRAATIMARHGGTIERAVYLPGDPPRELHVLRFPDEPAFAAYRDDPALAALDPPRASVVLATEIAVGEDGPSYSPA
jgi:hypothetical protein